MRPPAPPPPATLPLHATVSVKHLVVSGSLDRKAVEKTVLRRVVPAVRRHCSVLWPKQSGLSDEISMVLRVNDKGRVSIKELRSIGGVTRLESCAKTAVETVEFVNAILGQGTIQVVFKIELL